MRKVLVAGTVATAFAAALSFGANSVAAVDSSSVSLTGVVSSQEEGAMERVLVSAKRAGSTITVTVVSNAQGRYSFPRNRLEPGAYSVRIRAIGYELERRGTTAVTLAETATLDLTLRKTQDLAYQLSNGEWLMSMPGTDAQKQGLLGCAQCHTLEPIVRSRYSASEFPQIVDRMSRYAQGSTRLRPQLRPNTRGGSGGTRGAMGENAAGHEGERPVQQSRTAMLSEFMSTINLSSTSRWAYPLKTVPRPTGKATRVIITEYDLPRPETFCWSGSSMEISVGAGLRPSLLIPKLMNDVTANAGSNRSGLYARATGSSLRL